MELEFEIKRAVEGHKDSFVNLINECHNINQVKGKIIPIDEIEETVCEKSMVSRIDDNIEMKEILTYLENDLKSIVLLYYFEEFSIKEISRMLDIPEGTIKSRLSRARLKLKSIYKENFEGRECCGR